MVRPPRWPVMVAIGLATFITNLDNFVVNVALPSIQRDLGLPLSSLEWIVSGYILTFSSLMLVGGRLADVYGRKRIFLGGIALFAAASLMAGLAGNDTVLISARLLQGAGAALATPTCLAIISTTFTDAKERGLAVAVWTGVGALALAVGPVTGGLISQHLRWNWIFFINVPIGIAVIAFGFAAIPESRDLSGGRRLDLSGLLTSGLCLLCFTFALIEGQPLGWGSWLVVAALALGVVAAGGFVAVERRSSQPMVDTWFFRNQVFRGGIGVQITSGLGFTGVLVYTSLYLQNVLGFSPSEAGLAYLPLAVALIVFAPLAPQLAARIGGHRVGAIGFAIAALGMLLLTIPGQHAGILQTMPSLLLAGAGTALSTALTSTVLGVLPEQRSGVGSSVLNTSREMSGLFGVILVGAILVIRQNAMLSAGRTAVPAFLSGYRLGLVVCAVFVAAAGLISLLTLGRGHVPVAGEPAAQDAVS